MIRSYIIHLDGSTARQPLVDTLQGLLPAAEVLSAVDGRVMSEAERAAVCVPVLHQPAYPFPPKPGEVGCFLSHRKAWERIVASDDEAALIVEDDIVPAEGFEAALALALENAAPNRLIRFPLRDREEPEEVLASSGDVRLHRPRVVGLTTGMQLVGREAAARFLELTGQFDRPVDTFLQMRWLTGVETLTLSPAPVRSAVAETGGSTIQSHTSPLAEVKRSWHRMRYRGKVARLSGADR
ncbi:glycosyltransferase family 25 protein [Pseudooceanicola sp.]|uniref:glycosyltransferase family 25 protein n=1 Tax=Pseudooceanicola sp. TaxID=1914328 RepID=UPI0035C77520